MLILTINDVANGSVLFFEFKVLILILIFMNLMFVLYIFKRKLIIITQIYITQIEKN
jgi:hypothetical protein